MRQQFALNADAPQPRSVNGLQRMVADGLFSMSRTILFFDSNPCSAVELSELPRCKDTWCYQQNALATLVHLHNTLLLRLTEVSLRTTLLGVALTVDGTEDRRHFTGHRSSIACMICSAQRPTVGRRWR